MIISHMPLAMSLKDSTRSKCSSSGAVMALLGPLLLLSACDTSFQPFEASNRYHYSVYGTLNPAQDTQWVRVEPVAAPSTGGAPRDMDVTVTLTQPKSGQTWTLRDSVMEVFPGEPQHNFWTQAPIAPGSTYRLVVQNDEGDSTYATTTTPTTRPDVHVAGAIRLPCSQRCPSANTFEVRVDSRAEFAALRVRYFQTFQGSVNYTFDWFEQAEEETGTYVALVNYYENLRVTNSTIDRACIADSAQVITAVGGPDWPPWAEYRDASLSTIARPDSFSNVNGGHGLLAGVYTDTTLVPKKPRESPAQCSIF